MDQARRPWVLASALLLLGALSGAGAVYVHWLPCRGSMLSGSVLHGYAYGPDFSESCLRAMDAGFSLVWPSGAKRWDAESVLGTTTALLLALAWTVVVAGSRWSGRTKLPAGLPVVVTATAGATSLLGGGEALDTAFTWLLVAVDVLGIVAFVAIGVREEPGARVLLQSGLALAAVGAVGWFPLIGDYLVMAATSDANWDAPPGTGYVTVATIALLALALLGVTLARRPAARSQAASRSASAAVSALP